MSDPLTRGLPCDVTAERLILGSTILDHISHGELFSQLQPVDFSIEKHRRIYAAMQSLDAAGEKVDRLTVASKLSDLKQLQSVDGLAYLSSLDEGLPQFANIEAYIKIVKDKSSLRKIIYAAENLKNQCMEASGDPSSLIALADRSLMEIGYNPAEAAELLNPGEVVEQLGGMDAFLHPKSGLKTPWFLFTDMTGGYRRQELFVIAGNPSMGKSAMATQVAMCAAEAGEGVLMFSLEMSRASLVLRMACYKANINGAKVRAGYLNNEERGRLRSAIHEIAKLPLWIAEHGISTVSAIRAAVRRKRVKRDVFMVVIDYLQLLQGIGRTQNRNNEVSEITRSLKLLAVDEDVNVQLLSQLNRDNKKERRPPELQDLRESGSIEQDADAVAFVWRPEMLWRDKAELAGIAEIILGKQRNGPTGKIDLTWLGQSFGNKAEEHLHE